MNSIVLAYKATDKDKKLDAEQVKHQFAVEKLHFNLWASCFQSETHTPVLDVGLQLNDVFCAETLEMVLPFSLEKKDIKDLCGTIANTKNLCSAVFNEPYKMREGRTKIHIASREGDSKTPELYLYTLDINHDLTLTPDNYNKIPHTILSFNLKNILSQAAEGTPEYNATYYLRFRISSPSLSACVSDFTTPNRSFETLVKTTSSIELRLNDTRSMDESLEQKFSDKMAPVGVVHFLLLTKIDVDVDINGTDFKSKRLLEKDIWKNYLPDDIESNSVNGIIAYHFKKEPKDKEMMPRDIGSWEFFTKISTGICTGKTIFSYAVIVCILGALGSLVASILTYALEVVCPCCGELAANIFVCLLLSGYLYCNIRKKLRP